MQFGLKEGNDMKIRVYYEDTDLGGVVYHSNYLNFCERARSQRFFDRGLSPSTQQGHYVIKHIEAEYISFAKLGDLLEVKSKLIWMKAASFMLHQEIYNQEGKKLFEMDIILVFLSQEGKVQRFTKEQKELIQRLFE